MTKNEALKMAHEALKKFHYAMIDAGVLDRQEVLNEGFTAATAIKEALAQHDSVQAKPEPEQEPFAYVNVEKRTLEFAEPIKWHTPTVANLDRIPLFTKEALAQTQEPVACGTYQEVTDTMNALWAGTLEQVQIAEEMKNKKLYTTPPQRTEQEPVAWKLPDKNVVFWEDTKEVDEYHGFEPTIPLYSHPQRTWQGLTDEETAECFEAKVISDRLKADAKRIEAKLKEKNT